MKRFFLTCLLVFSPALALALPSTVVNSRDYATLNAAITAIGSSQRTLGVSATLAASGNVTIPATAPLDFTGGEGQLSCVTHTLTINGPIINPTNRQIFDSTCDAGEVINNGPTATRPEWWGDITSNTVAALRKAVAAIGTQKVVQLSCGTYTLDGVDSASLSNGVYLNDANSHLTGNGYCSEIKVRAASYSGNVGRTFITVAASNVAITNLRINGDRANISGALTSYNTVGIRIEKNLAQAVTGSLFADLWLHDFGGATLEGFGILPAQAGAGVTNTRMLNITCDNIWGACVSAGGDYRDGMDGTDYFIDGIVARNNQTFGVTIYGARNVFVSNVECSGNQGCINVEWSRNVDVRNFLAYDNTVSEGRCLSVFGNVSEVRFSDGKCARNTGTGQTHKGEIQIRQGQWETGSPWGYAESVEFKDVFVERSKAATDIYDLTVTADVDQTNTVSATVTASITSNVITRSAGSWITDGFLPYQGIMLQGFSTAANNDVLRRVLSVTATDLTLDTKSGTLTDEASGASKTVTTVNSNYPYCIVLNGGNSAEWTIRNTVIAAGGESVQASPTLRRNANIVYKTTDRQGVPVPLGKLINLYVTGGSITAYSGDGELNPDGAVTYAAAGASQRLESDFVLEPYTTYLVRARAKARATTYGWRLFAASQTGGVLADSYIYFSGGDTSPTIWREASAIFTTDSVPYSIRIQNESGGALTIDLDYLEVVPLSHSARAANGMIPFVRTVAVTSASQNPLFSFMPAGVVVTNVTIEVTEAFNSSGTDLLSVGDDGGGGANNTYYASDGAGAGIDVSTTGVKSPTLTNMNLYQTSSRRIEAYYVNGGGEPTTGKAIVTLSGFYVPNAP